MYCSTNDYPIGEADAKLLVSILALHNIKIDYANVAAMMGPDCTQDAVKNRIKKLKKAAADQAGGVKANETPEKVII